MLDTKYNAKEVEKGKYIQTTKELYSFLENYSS